MRYSDFKIVEAIPTDSNDPRGPDQRNDPNAEVDAGGLQAGPPYPPEQMDAVKALQTKLEELGYSVGSTGIDGKYGPRTARAVAAYLKDFGKQDTDAGKTISAVDLSDIESAERKENPSPTGNGRVFTPGDLEALNFGGAGNAQAKGIAEEFLGTDISDDEWNYLVRATIAEASPNQQERGAVAAVILNRVKSNRYPNDIISVLRQRNQFQAVTGTRPDPGPSRNFRNPTQRQVATTVQAIIDHLPNANTSWLNFTSNNPRAYGPGTNVGFMAQVKDSPGSRVIGGTVFGTV